MWAQGPVLPGQTPRRCYSGGANTLCSATSARTWAAEGGRPTFVQEEVTLRRPLGGRAVLRRQLEHLLAVGQLRHVEFQVMPTDREDHAGMGGELQVLKLKDGSAVGQFDAQLTTRLVSDPKEVHLLELRYGIIRSQALSPRESRAFVETVLGET